MITLMAAGCTDSEKPNNGGTPVASRPSAAASSMTFDEAYQQVPIDGVGDLKINWDLPQEADVDEVLAARRGLTHAYWRSEATDWTPIMTLAPFLFTERYYQQVLAGLGSSGAGDPLIGPIWVKLMGVEKLGPDQARVTFCTDIGWWHEASNTNPQIRKDRANLESLVVENVQTGDGERRWLADQRWNPDADRKAKYGADCTKWAQHQP
ncbi:hypothetical protein SAMN05421541_11085 [Actinoplanes philippinensis]|uniref:Uncharacterized protein n=2 Tax=Actinoplanes philippinensis TaxID=35752 RepID=A0A1I2II70_9ACTN|nr:hypothetical protein SAMN05421541_11085 [Actinoplanes philippinensis]